MTTPTPDPLAEARALLARFHAAFSDAGGPEKRELVRALEALVARCEAAERDALDYKCNAIPCQCGGCGSGEQSAPTCDCNAPDCVDRTNCKDAGKPGHKVCGICPEHSIPRHSCDCWAKDEKSAPTCKWTRRGPGLSTWFVGCCSDRGKIEFEPTFPLSLDYRPFCRYCGKRIEVVEGEEKP